MTPTTVPDGPLSDWPADPTPEVAEVLRRGADLALTGASRVGPPVLALLLVLVLARELLRCRRAASLAAGARVVSIVVPPEVDAAGAEVLWANLHELLRPRWRRILEGQLHLAFELIWDEPGLTIGLWVPGPVPPGLVERAVEAAWPASKVSVAEPTSPLADCTRAVGGELRLAAPEWFPLRADHDAEPMRALLGAAGGVGPQDKAVVQVLARPLTGRRLARCHKVAVRLRSGRPVTAKGRLLDLLSPGRVAGLRPADDPALAGEIRSILAKASSPAWEVVVRYGVATTAADADANARLRGRAHAMASAFALYTGRNRLARRRLRRAAVALSTRRLRRGALVSVPELAALAHLPTDVVVPGLARAGAKTVAPPPALASVGKVLGDAETGTGRPVALSPSDARYHLHVLGATGSGKSTLLTNLVLQDVAAGRGVVVIDPKGDLVTDVLERLPAGTDVVLVDPDEAEAPPTLNVLEGPDLDLAVDHLVGIFRRIFEAYWGPRTDDVLRSACLTLLRRESASLADVPRLLSDERFRRPFVEDIDDPVGLGGFWAWYEAMTEAQQAQVIGPVMNKLRAFLLRGFVRAVVGQPSSSFDLDRVLGGGCCLVRVPKGILGEETARLLGSFVVAKVWQAATARARQGQADRLDASLYVDECQNFLTLPRSFEEMLAEARGYGLSLVLAHQHLAQLPRDLRDAVSTNARSKVFFATSPEDARSLERHVAPELSAHDLAHLGAYQAAARLVIAAEEAPAFTLRTRPAPAPAPGRARAIRSSARARYGRTEAQRQQEAARRDAPADDIRRTRLGAATYGSAYGSTYGSAYGSRYGLRPVVGACRGNAGQGDFPPTDPSPYSRGDEC